MRNLKTFTMSLIALGMQCAFAQTPAILIDYTRLEPPFGITEVPPGILKKLRANPGQVALSWALIDERNSVHVRLRERTSRALDDDLSVMRAFTLHFESLEDYQALTRLEPNASGEVKASPVHVSSDVLSLLRERRRVMALSSELGVTDDHSSSFPRLLQDPYFMSQMPPGLEWLRINLRAVQSEPDQRYRLNVSGLAHGEEFRKDVCYEGLDELNRTSGLKLTNEDFNRRTLFYWILPPSMDGRRYAMKTREEIAMHCPEMLTQEVSTEPSGPILRLIEGGSSGS